MSISKGLSVKSVVTNLLFSIAISGIASAAAPADRFERITPAQAGYSVEKLQVLSAFLEQSGSDSLLLLHDGKVFFEWGDIRKKILIHSMRKAVLNGVYGVYAGRPEMNLQQTLKQLKIDDLEPALTEPEQSATLLDVLKSRSGVYHPAAAEDESMIGSRPARGSHPSGEFYYYNNWDFNVAGAVFEQQTSKRLYDVFYEQIAKPLGMLDYHNHILPQQPVETKLNADIDGYYQYEPDRSKYPAYHFRMSAHDLALYGQLFLNGGRWQGKQIIPAEWIALSTKPYSITEPEYGLAYGMLWDVLVPDSPDEQASFYHTGVGVHMLGVYPKHKLVMVHRVDTEREFRFNDGDLYRVIRMVHGARLAH